MDKMQTSALVSACISDVFPYVYIEVEKTRHVLQHMADVGIRYTGGN